MPKKFFKRAAGFAAVSGAAYLALGHIAYSQFFTRKAAGRNMNSLPDSDILEGRPRLADAMKRGPVDDFFYKNSGMDGFFANPHFPVFQEGVRWYLEKGAERAAIDSPLGGRTHADVFRNEEPSGVWVICLHGYTSCPRDCGEAAKVFYEWGYNVLLPYLGGHGRSENPAVSMGWLDRFDVVAWINHIINENQNAKIILYGASMGGAAVMMTTGEALPENVVCAVEDCGYTSFWDEYACQAKAMLSIPAFPALYALDTAVRMRQGYSMKDASCVEQVKKSKTPTLFIHGEADEIVPFEMFGKIYEAAACEKEKITFPGASHGGSSDNTEEYYGAVRSFIDKYL